MGNPPPEILFWHLQLQVLISTAIAIPVEALCQWLRATDVSVPEGGPEEVLDVKLPGETTMSPPRGVEEMYRSADPARRIQNRTGDCGP